MKWRLYGDDEIFVTKEINAPKLDGSDTVRIFLVKDSYIIYGHDTPDTALRFLIPSENGYIQLESGYYFLKSDRQVFFGRLDSFFEEESAS